MREHSYTARLLQGPKEVVLRKVGEEALEVVLEFNRPIGLRCLENWKSVTLKGATETADDWPPALKNQAVPTVFESGYHVLKDGRLFPDG